MISWYQYFKRAFLRKHLPDPLGYTRKPGDTRRNFKNLIPFFKKYWKKGALGFLLILFSTLMVFPIPLIYKSIIDNVIINGQIRLLAGLAIAYASIKILGKVSSSFLGFFFSRFEQTIILDIQTKLLDHTLKLPKSFFDQREVGYLMSRLLSDVSGLRFFFSSTLMNIVTSVIQFIGGLVFLFYLKWELAIIIGLVIPVIIWIVHFFSKRIYTLSHHNMEQNAHISKVMQESLTISPLVKAYSFEKPTLKAITDQLKKALNLNLEGSSLNTGASFSIGLLPEITRFFILVAGAIMIVNGDWTVGALMAFQSYTGYIFGPAMFIANINFQLQRSLVSLERVSGLFDIVPEKNLRTGKTFKNSINSITFKEVSFTYTGNQKVLDHINFDLKTGRVYALIGESGVGKTTLVSIMLGFYRPTSGNIYFNGIPLNKLNLSHLRQRIGYLSQTPYIICGTVEKNIKYGSFHTTRKDIERAAKLAGIDDFINGLSKKYQEQLGEDGTNLSQGQKQRIALARVIIKNPDIIILDEPTSALDKKTGELFNHLIPILVKTKIIIVITHSLDILKEANDILLLKKNGTLNLGTHSQFIKEPYYSYLIENKKP